MRTIAVIPAKAGIQLKQVFLDPGFRLGDGIRLHGINQA
jgi:hypothetical protein